MSEHCRLRSAHEIGCMSPLEIYVCNDIFITIHEGELTNPPPLHMLKRVYERIGS